MLRGTFASRMGLFRSGKDGGTTTVGWSPSVPAAAASHSIRSAALVDRLKSITFAWGKDTASR
jgi:hypothetical protein